MRIKYFTTTPQQTKKLGEILAKEVLKMRKTKFYSFPKRKISAMPKQAFILGLEGDLGGGKTTFLQGFAKGLGIKTTINSPTFVIIKKFLISNSQFLNFYHIDCYRISKLKEILDLGFKEMISNPKNIVAIEWSDKIRKILPKKSLILKFEFIGKNKRKITLRGI